MVGTNASMSCNTPAKRYSYAMSDKDGINEVTGILDVYRLCPNEGDSIMVVNCGSHFELHHHSWNSPHPFGLTEQEVNQLRQGLITWN